nr:MAG TPA: hypothetical protein [Caudoviricetes sp.]
MLIRYHSMRVNETYLRIFIIIKRYSYVFISYYFL